MGYLAPFIVGRPFRLVSETHLKLAHPNVYEKSFELSPPSTAYERGDTVDRLEHQTPGQSTNYRW